MTAVVSCIVEGELGDTPGCRLRNELDTLHHTINDLVLDTRILAFRVLTDGHYIDIVVECPESFN